MKKKNLFIDGQVFQSAAWDRGMGKYSLNFIKALLGTGHYYESASIIFTKYMPLKEEAKRVLKEAVPNASWHFIDLKIPGNPTLSKIESIQKHNKQLLEEFIRQQSRDDKTTDFLILSLFIEQVCSVFPDTARKILLFYDLIPFQYSEHYSRHMDYANYLTRFKVIMAADCILTISQTVADDLITNLGINPGKICNIEGAPIERKHQKPQKPKDMAVPKRYVLMPTGDEFRKNNLRAVQGFEECRNSQTEDTYLLITSFFDEATKRQLKTISPNLIFTGNVSEAELRWLYEHCESVLFVSEYEGLGLPILEGVETRKPVVCSNISTFNEMSIAAFYYANQFDPASIAEALGKSLARQGWLTKLKEYPAIETRYTWPHTVQKAMEFLGKSYDSLQVKPKPRIAVLAPNPTGISAIGKVVLQLHAELSKYFDVHYYVGDGKRKQDFFRPSYLPYVAEVYKASEFNARRYAEYEAVIYHIGNSEYHLEAIESALYLPGYVIIHDTHLKGVFEENLSHYGYVSKTRMLAERSLDSLLKSTKADYLTSIVNAQRGIIVHSRYAEEAIRSICIGDVPIRKLNLPTGTPQISRMKIDKTFTIGFGGIIHVAKGINVLEEIIASPKFADAHICIFGIPMVGTEVLNKLKAYPNVTLITNPSDFKFQTMLSQMDVVVSYRPQYRGETSLTIIEAMRFGVVPLVRKIGWFDELPDDCVMKAETANEVLGLLETISKDTKKRLNMSANARKLMTDEFNYEEYAKGIADFIAEGSKGGINEQIGKALKNKATPNAIIEMINSL